MDIDIDVTTEFNATQFFGDKITVASRVEKGELYKHNCGTYFQKIPIDKETGWAAIPYDITDDIGYKKIDFIHVNLLKHFNNKAELRTLLKKEPDWSMLEDMEIVDQLFQLNGHFDIVSKVKPRSIEEIADTLAMIRPGKGRLLDKYIKDPKSVRAQLYTKEEKSDFRKSHSIPYAMLVVLHMNLLKRNVK